MADPADRSAPPKTAPVPRRRRWRRWLGRFVGLLLVLVLAAGGAGWWALRTDDGRAWLRAAVLDVVNGLEGVTVRLGALEGDLPVSWRLRDLSVADAEGVWLSAERITLAWDPWALLSGRLHVTEATAQALSVVRAPASAGQDAPPEDEAEDEAGGGFDPRLLGRVRLDRLALEGLHLGAALTGGEAILATITGRFGAERDGSGALAAGLEARRIDGGDGVATVSARLHGADLDRLSVAVDASEGGGGTVSRLLGLPDGAGWSITLAGDGPAADWRGDLSARADGLAGLDGTLALDLGDLQAPGGRLDLTATPTEAAPETWRAVLTDRLSLTLAAAMAPGGAVTVSDLALRSDALSLSGAASLDAAADTVALRLDGALDDPSRLAPLVALPLEAATLTVRAEGALTAPTVTATMSATRPGVDAIGVEAFTLTATATPDGPLGDPDSAVRLDLDGRLEGLRGPAGLGQVLPYPLALRAEGMMAADASGLRDLRLTLTEDDDTPGRVALTLEGEAGLAPALSAGARARLDVADLGRLAPLAGGLSLLGSGTLTLSDVSVGKGGVVTGAVDLALSGAALNIAQADTLLGPSPRLGAQVRFDPAEGLAVEGLTLSGQGVTLAGEAAFPGDFSTIDATLTGALDSLADVGGPALAGAVWLDAVLSGSLGNPDAEVVATLPEATLGGQAWRDIQMDLTARGLAEGPRGDVALEGTGPGGVVALAAGIALPGYGRAEVSDLTLTAPGASLDGAIAADFASGLMTGALSLAVTEAGQLSAWGAPEMAGRLTADVTLDAPDNGQRVAVTARSPGLTAAGTTLGALSLEATLRDALGTPALGADLTLTGGNAGEALSWSRLALSAEGPLGDLALRADLDATAPPGPLTLAASARLRAPGLAAPEATPGLTLSTLSLETGGHRVALRQPATLRLDDGARVDRLALALDDGSLTLEGGLTQGGALDVSINGADLPLALATLAAEDLSLQGRVGLSASLKGALPTPQGTVSVTARDVRLEAGSTAPPLAAELSGQLSNGRLKAEATLSGFAPTPARLTADVPLRLGGGDPVPMGQPLSASLVWNGPVARVWEMLPLVEHRLAGDLVLDASVSGTLAAPDIMADVRLSDGRYEHLSAGTLIDDLTVTAQASGSETVSVSLSGGDGGAGRISGEGQVTLGPDGPVGSVSVTARDATVVRRDDVTASTDADLTLDLEGDGGRLSGTVRTREVRVRLVGGGAGSVNTLDVVEIDRPGETAMAALDERLAEEARERAQAGGDGDEEAGGFAIALAIEVDIPNRVYVSGQGLESEWGGRLAVGGTAARPTVTGVIALRSGSFEAIGKQFALEKGEVRFSGGHPINPLLDVVAFYQTDDVEARIGARGPASDPEIVLESVPPLPRDEVLSQILFGKQAGSLTALEAVQLTRALAALSGIGGGGGPGIVDGLRQAVGLDVLRVGGEGLEAGTYLGDDIYVGVEQGLSRDSGGVSVDVDLGAGFKVESKARRSGQGEVGIMWRKDY